MTEEQTTTEVTMNEEQMAAFVQDYIDAVMGEEVDVEKLNEMSTRVPSDDTVAKQLLNNIKAALEELEDTEKRNNAIQAVSILIEGIQYRQDVQEEEAAHAEQATEQADTENAPLEDTTLPEVAEEETKSES